MDLSKALLQFISEFFLKVAALRPFTKGAMTAPSTEHPVQMQSLIKLPKILLKFVTNTFSK